MEKDLKRQILEIIIWFDIFDYPLKREDFGLVISDQLLVIRELKKLVLEKKIEEKDGFYFLSGREELIEKRKKKEKISERKMFKARQAVNFLKRMPFVRAIILTSNLSFLNAEESSDIDFLIISAKNRIWTTRWLTTFWFKILNLRPTNGNGRDKFCFSFYLDESELNLSKTKVELNDLALKYFLSTYKCLYDAEGVWNRFLDENKWAFGDELKSEKVKKKKVIIKKFFEKLFNDGCEKFFKKIQLWYMPKNLKLAAEKNDKKVIINDKILKLHLNDKRKELNEKIRNKLEYYEN